MAMLRRWLHRLSRSLPGGKRSGSRPTRPWVFSLLLLALFVGLGWSSMPADLANTTSALRFEDPQQAGAGIVTPVFVLLEDGAAVRFGDAEQEAGGVVRVGLYDPLDPLLAHATVAASLPADGRLLWLLASPEERRTLREKSSALVLGLSASATEIARSPAFQADYREPLMQILRDAVQTAWAATRENGAWQDLLRGYEPILRAVSSRDLRPILERNFLGVALRMFKANALTMIDPFHDRVWNIEPIEQALRDTFDEIRERNIPEHTAVRLLESPRTTAFLHVFAAAAGDKLAHDPALQNLIAQMVYDPRFRPAMQPAIDGLLDLGRTAPRLLTSVRGGTDLNLAAATALRTTLLGRADRVVVFMTPHQRAELATFDGAIVHTLIPLVGAATGAGPMPAGRDGS